VYCQVFLFFSFFYPWSSLDRWTTVKALVHHYVPSGFMRGTSHRISSSSHPKHPGHPWDHYGPTVSLPSQSSGQSLKILKIRILKYYLDLFGLGMSTYGFLQCSIHFHPISL
jgi:hypothetical protein